MKSYELLWGINRHRGPDPERIREKNRLRHRRQEVAKVPAEDLFRALIESRLLI